MYAIEFETKGKGRYIELPFTLSTKKSINVRVILMSEQKIRPVRLDFLIFAMSIK